ncbi:MAG: hypothetical protein ACR2N9_03190 [Acidimicrobiia bacterium]
MTDTTRPQATMWEQHQLENLRAAHEANRLGPVGTLLGLALVISVAAPVMWLLGDQIATAVLHVMFSPFGLN